MLNGKDNVDWDWFEMIPEKDERQYRTRAADGGLQLRRGRPRLEVRRNFFSQQLVEKWNNFPVTTKRNVTIAQLKSELRLVHLLSTGTSRNREENPREVENSTTNIFIRALQWTTEDYLW